MQLLRSIIFNLIFYPLIIFASVVIIILYPLISRESLQRVANFWVMTVLFILKIVCGIDWEVKGVDNIKDEPCILVSNHQGVWESFFIQTLAIPSFSILKKELLYIPIFGLAVSCLNPIYIKRSNKISSLKKVINDGSRRLKSGGSIIIFPKVLERGQKKD